MISFTWLSGGNQQHYQKACRHQVPGEGGWRLPEPGAAANHLTFSLQQTLGNYPMLTETDFSITTMMCFEFIRNGQMMI